MMLTVELCSNVCTAVNVHVSTFIRLVKLLFYAR